MFGRKKPALLEAPTKIKIYSKIGLVLSGGGARGFAHIGAIKAFEEERIVFDYVVGTSAGSIVGALYAYGYSSAQMIDFANSLTNHDIKGRRILMVNSPSSKIEALVDRMMQGATFDDLKMPFRAVAVDIVSGEETVLSSGKVAKAVSASCAVPFIFTPVKIDDALLVDGGLLNTIPSDVARTMGAEYVISVDINSTRGQGAKSTHLFDTATAVWRIVMKSTAYKGYMNSDVTIQPDLARFSSTTLKQNISAMIEEGYNATKLAMPEIKDLLGIKPPKASKTNKDKK